MIQHFLSRLKISSEDKLSYLLLCKWILISIISGITGSLVVHFFVLVISDFSSLLKQLPLCPVFWTALGAIFVGGTIYKTEPRAAGEGIPSYIQGINLHGGDLPFQVTFYKFFAALVTLCTFGNGGVVGPLGRVSAGIMSSLEKKISRWGFGFDPEDQRTACICGLSAAIGAIFHSSIGGGIFAVEIIKKTKMGYKDLFPSVLSSATAVFFCKAVGWESFYRFKAIDRFMDVNMIGWLVILSLLAGWGGSLFIYLYSGISGIIKRNEGSVVLKVFLGSLLASSLAWAVNPELLGTSSRMIPAILTGNMDVLTGRLGGLPFTPFILLILLVCKAVCNCVTVGSGMSAGFTGPVVICGMLLGSSLAHLLDIPPGTATYFAFIAAGFSGMLASAMNVPLAAAVMTLEIFGLEYSFPAGFAAVMGFQMSRHHTLYDYSLSDKALSFYERLGQED